MRQLKDKVTRRLHPFCKAIAVLVIGFIVTAAIAEENNPHQMIRASADLIMATIEDQKQIHGNEVTEDFIQALMVVLKPIIDFESIARAVTGRHRDSINADQAEQLLRVVSNTMVKLYLESFIGFEVQAVEVLDPEANFDVSSGRATIRTEAIAARSTYAVNYSMRTDGAGRWKVRNVIIDGINLGLTYRNQFDGVMARYDQDVDEVIANWDKDVVVEQQ